MATNFGYAGTGVGLIKIVHILFGIITVGCLAPSYDNGYLKERFFFGAAITCFIVSLIYYIVHLLSYGVAISGVNKAIDEVYHFVGAVLLLVGASLFLQGGVSFNNDVCKNIPVDPNDDLCGPFATKVAAGAFGLINGILYLITIVLRTVEVDDDENVGSEAYKP